MHKYFAFISPVFACPLLTTTIIIIMLFPPRLALLALLSLHRLLPLPLPRPCRLASPLRPQRAPLHFPLPLLMTPPLPLLLPPSLPPFLQDFLPFPHCRLRGVSL